MDNRPFKSTELRQLNEVIKELTTDRLIIMAIPGTIRNSGKNVPAIEVTIGDNLMKKKHVEIYRGLVSNFRTYLKKRLDIIANAPDESKSKLIIDPKSL